MAVKKIRIEILVPIEDWEKAIEDWEKAIEEAKKQKFSLKKEILGHINMYARGLKPYTWSKGNPDKKKRETTWFKELFGADGNMQGAELRHMDGKKWVTIEEFWSQFD